MAGPTFDLDMMCVVGGGLADTMRASSAARMVALIEAGGFGEASAATPASLPGYGRRAPSGGTRWSRSRQGVVGVVEGRHHVRNTILGLAMPGRSG
jgi:hypothetical protein